MSLGGSHSQRSRSGCLTCRRKRKKCDEQQPFCSRCTRTNSRCIWPGQSESDASPPSNDSLSYDVNTGDVPLSFLYHSEPTRAAFYASEDNASRHFIQKSVSLTSGILDLGYTRSDLLELKAGSSLGLPSDNGVDMNLTKPLRPSWSIEPQSIPAPSSDANGNDMILPDLTHNKAMGTRIWEYTQDFGPRIIWPNRSTDDNEDFDPEGVMPLIRRSVATLRISEEPNFQQMLDFYSIYLSRYISDYAAVCDILFSRVRRRFVASDSLKHAMMGTALLFRANYEASSLTESLRYRSKEHYQLATRALRLELESNYLSTSVKIAGLVELMNYEYAAGHLFAYYHHLDQAASLVRSVIGSEAIDFANLTGEQTFDIRCIAWYDILSSMALARPTLLDYKTDTQGLSSLSRWDQMFDSDHGIEWIVGCPDALVALVARISALRHARISPEEKNARGAEIEQLARDIQLHPVRAKSPALRVARLAVQEICRHAVILYVHHTIFKSDPSNSIVRCSVKAVIKLASILKPGLNPDCFVPVPYFIAGAFAESDRDRITLRNRILSCGNERYLRYLAARLDNLWKEVDATGRLDSWSGMQPPTFVF